MGTTVFERVVRANGFAGASLGGASSSDSGSAGERISSIVVIVGAGGCGLEVFEEPASAGVSLVVGAGFRGEDIG